MFHHINNRTSKDQDGLNFDNIFKLQFDKDDANINANSSSESPHKKSSMLTDEPTAFYRLDSSSSSSSEQNFATTNKNHAYNSQDFSDLNQLPRSQSFINSNTNSTKSHCLTNRYILFKFFFFVPLEYESFTEPI